MKKVNLLLDTPLGWFEISGSATVIQGSRWVLDDDAVVGSGLRSVAWKEEAEKQVKAYFDGVLERFNLPLELDLPEGQKAALEAVMSTEKGALQTFDQFLEQFNGSALRKTDIHYAIAANAFALIIPTHRIVFDENEAEPSPMQQVNEALRSIEQGRRKVA